MSNSTSHHPSSYRDPSGFVFEVGGVYYRQVNYVYQKHYDEFIKSNCYKYFTEKGILIAHEETAEIDLNDEACYKILKPEQINFITYPWEWSFDMLKDAALLTLQIAGASLQFGMTLKDATPFNIQWHKGKLIFIDTLSFEIYNPQAPWIAYSQFCETFLAPLLLMHHTKKPLQSLMLAWPDGIPLDIAKALLPQKTKFSLHTYLHIHLHSKIATKSSGSKTHHTKFSKQKFINLLSSLEILIKKLKAPDSKTTWSNYYDEAAQRDGYLENKKALVEEYLTQLNDVKTAIDLGANDGQFSKLLAFRKISTITSDFDATCINHLYHAINEEKEFNIQPLVLDVKNPSPSIGFNNKERSSFLKRAKFDLTLALALIHHLAIGKNIPLTMIADFFASIAPNLIIEFVPKEDEKVKMMLSGKKDIYINYSEAAFEKAFSKHYLVVSKKTVGNSNRSLYLMKRNEK
ncbi:MAG: SAM-dependent methyltransferase [Bacteroidetes bacterium]|nr:SAM-dependent methyltransferase [Bacteroidota bacterium]